MFLSHDQIIGLPVETQSGRRLGKIHGLIIESGGQNVQQYSVKTAGVALVFAKNLLVGREQVVSLDEEKMVVEDSAAAGEEKSAAPATG